MDITILAPTAKFASVEEAAEAEARVDWQAAIGPEQIACTLCFAATELADHLELLDGVSVSTGPLPDAESGTPTIRMLIDQTAVDVENATDTTSIDTPADPQSFRITTRTTTNGSVAGYEIAGADPAGALYGAYELLHQLGFRWFSPDPWDRAVPASLVPVDIDLEESPSFPLRGFWATDDRGTEAFLLWMARNKLNLWSAEQPEKEFCRKLGIKFTTGGHTIFARYADPERYFAKHPEWYGLRDGKRSGDIRGVVGDNICFANDEVRSHIATGLVDDLVSGEWKWVDLINVWALDNGKYCTCNECAAIGNPTDQIMLLAHDCRQAIVKAQASGRLNRGVIVSIPAYHETLEVPQNPLPEDFDHEGIVATFFPIERCFVHTFADPGCSELNGPLVDYWENWTANPENPFKGAMLVGEYYNVSSYASLAIPAVRTMAADIPYYYRTGARLMHYMHVGTAKWGQLSLTNTQFAALLWNHELDSDAFVADYFANRFHASSEAVSMAYRITEDAMVNAKPLKHYAGMERHTLRNTLRPTRESGDRSNAAEAEDLLFTTRHLRYDDRLPGANSGPALTETIDLLHQAGRLLDDELLYCDDPIVRERLRSDIRRHRYTETTIRFFYHAARVRMFEAAGDAESALLEARALRDAGEALRRETEMPKLSFAGERDDWHRFYRNGLAATWVVGFYKETMERYDLEVPEDEATDGAAL